MRIGLKLAILKSGQSQREVCAQTRPPIPESRFSSIVRGWTTPRAEERAELRRVLRVGDEAFQSDSPALDDKGSARR